MADNTQKIQDDACSRTGKKLSTGSRFCLEKTNKRRHDSFRKIRSRLREEGLQHIAEDLSFTSFTTLDPDRFFGGMRTPSRPTPDMYDYATRRPCCSSESVEKIYQSSFVFYIQAPRVTTYNGECTRKSPNGCTRGHRSTEVNVQRERVRKHTRTGTNYVRRPKTCERLLRNLSVRFVNKEQEGRQKRMLGRYL